MFNRRRAVLEKLPDLLAKLGRVFVMMDGNSMLNRCVQEFLVAICGQRDRAIRFARKFTAIDVLAGHDHCLLDWRI
jgi:hypothetical protein